MEKDQAAPLPNARFSISVAQLGARMHYAVPRILQAADMLEHLFTDATGGSAWARVLQVLPSGLQAAPVKRLAGRIPCGVPRERITAFERFGWEYAWRLWRAQNRGQEAQAEVHLWSAREFCRMVLAKGLGQAEGVYGFNGACLELMEFAGRHRLFGVVEQTIAPHEIEARLLAAEREAYPGWEVASAANRARSALADRAREEWAHATLILCASEFVRRGIAECGGPVERCVVVPYGVDLPLGADGNHQHDGSLRVLTCGSLGLRKGAPYALAAARLTMPVAEFRWLGPIGVLPQVLSEIAAHIDVRGPVPRTAMPAEYAWADVFLLPSICEGSATVCYEALAAGLPVITTPNAGSVVRDGVDGFIVPIRDAEAIAAKLELLARDRGLLAWMSGHARERSREFTVEKYGERLISTVNMHVISTSILMSKEA